MLEEFRKLLGRLADGHALTRPEAEHAFDVIMSGQATPAQIGGFLMALRVRGETVSEIAAAAHVMRAKMRPVRLPAGAADRAIDIVGTGGDGKGTLNISTAAALVTAGAGVTVAKHGNRKLSSQSGAGDVLAALGIEVEVEPETVEAALAEVGLAFMIAPRHHAAIRHVMPARTELGVRTLFNILGPMTNPAGVTRQLTGVYDPKWLEPMAETLRDLGSDRVWIVHGGDGTDELSIAAPSQVAQLEGGAIRRFEISPGDAGLPTHDFALIRGGDPAYNASALRALLDGRRSAYRDAVLLNAAAALVIAEAASDLVEGAAIAAAAIDDGRAKAKADALAAFTQARKAE